MPWICGTPTECRTPPLVFKDHQVVAEHHVASKQSAVRDFSSKVGQLPLPKAQLERTPGLAHNRQNVLENNVFQGVDRAMKLHAHELVARFQAASRLRAGEPAFGVGFALDKMGRNFEASRKSKRATSSVTLDTVRRVVGSTFGFECQAELTKGIDDAVLNYWRSYGNTTADPDKPGQTTNAVLPPGFQSRPARNKIAAELKKRGSLAA